jgi:dTMP kinase
MNERFAPRPDLVFILDLEASRGLQRIRKRKKKDRLFERGKYLARVRKLFRSFGGRNIVHLDGRENRDKIKDAVAEKVFSYLKKRL